MNMTADKGSEFVRVPVEPTEAMLKAAHAAMLSDIPPDGESAYGPTISTHAIYRAYWAAMLSAAPAPQPVEGEAVGYVDGSRLHELREGRLNIALWNERGGNADTPLYTQPPAPAVVDGRIMDGDVRAIACALARLDGYDPSDENGGLYDLRWAGGPEPEPLGDAWNMDYMPKAKKIAAAIGYRSAPPIKPTPAVQIAAPGDVEQRARELLAAEYECAGDAGGLSYASAIRAGHAGFVEAIRAISAALRSHDPAYGPDGSMSIHCQQDGCQMYKHPPECWSQGQAVAVGDAMVERACRAYFPGWETFHPEAWKAPRRLGMRAAITAALAQQANKEQPPNA